MFCIPWFLVGAGAAAAMAHSAWEGRILEQRGIAAQATPVSIEPGKGKNRRHTDIVWEFQDQNGVRRTVGLRTQDTGRIEAASQRLPEPVRYDSEDSTRARLVADKPLSVLFAALVGPAVVMPGGVGLLIALLKALRALSLYRRGHAVLATVTHVEQTGSSTNKRPVVRAHYEFPGSAGAPVRGSWKHDAAPREAGARLWVLYDPMEPRNNLPA